MSEIKPVSLAKIKECALAVSGWDNMHDAWNDVAEDSNCAIVGHDHDGELYPLAVVDCGQYDQPEESIKVAKFYAAANPKAILELVAALEALQAENERLDFKFKHYWGRIRKVLQKHREREAAQAKEIQQWKTVIDCNEQIRSAQAKRIAELEKDNAFINNGLLIAKSHIGYMKKRISGLEQTIINCELSKPIVMQVDSANFSKEFIESLSAQKGTE